MEVNFKQRSWTAKSPIHKPYLGFCLSLIGWIFILIALPSGPILMAGAIEINIIPEVIGIVISGFIIIVLMAGGVACVRKGQQLKTPSAISILEKNQSFLLYLRSFSDDQLIDPTARAFKLIRRRYEESLCNELNRFAPLIAIGRPGKKLPEIGAARMYVSGKHWQNAVSEKR